MTDKQTKTMDNNEQKSSCWYCGVTHKDTLILTKTVTDKPMCFECEQIEWLIKERPHCIPGIKFMIKEIESREVGG